MKFLHKINGFKLKKEYNFYVDLDKSQILYGPFFNSRYFNFGIAFEFDEE